MLTRRASPLAAGLLTCLTIGLAVRLAAHTAAHATLAAHAGAPQPGRLLPLSLLPASATDEQRQTAWFFEIADREYIQATVACGLWGKKDRTLHLTFVSSPRLHFGDLIYTQDVVVQPAIQRMKTTHRHTAAGDETMQTSMPSVAAGPPRRMRLTSTRTASGLHVASAFLPDQPLTH